MSKTSKAFAAVLLSLWASLAYADGLANPPPAIDLSAFARKSDLSAVQSMIMSAMPLPADSDPKADAGAGSMGSAIRYLRADSVRPSQSRSIMVTLDANGAATGAWKTPLKSPVPGAVSPVNANSATAQMNCNFTALSQSDFSIKCTQQLLTPSVSTMVTSPLNSPAPAGTQVGVTIMESQP